MEALKFEDSKKLFVARTFGGDKECPTKFAATTEKILKRCAGLPLAIVSIANVLAGYTSAESHDKWESIYNSMGSQMERHPTLEGMKQIITLSYNHLPHELKACMMYLSIFPEDYEIDKHRLLCRWIAEGLVMEKRGMTLMEVAKSYLDELVSRNMIELRVDFEVYWRVELCRVHDMLLEVMVSKSLESNFVSLLGGQYAGLSYGRIRRLSIQGGDDRRPQEDTEQRRSKKMLGHGIEGMDVEHARSLSMFQRGQDVKNLLDHLYKFTLLRVLDLEGCQGITEGHMKCICRLYLLRFLNLRGTDIKEVPSNIKNLEHLQTLDVRETSVQDLPGTVKELYKLERLKIGECDAPGSRWRLPRGVSKMKALRELALAGLGDDVEVAKEVGKLEQLEELSIYADTNNITDDKVLPALAGSLSNLHSLRRLIIGELSSFKKGALNFLHEMPKAKSPQLLQFLMIDGAMDKGLPPWIESLTHLVQFNTSFGQLDQGDQLFSVLCKLPNLKIICLYDYSYRGHDLVASSKHKFPELTNLRVYSSSETPKGLVFEEGSMAKLETLLFTFSEYEKRIEGIEHLTSLKQVHLWSTKDNHALERALEQLRVENQRRSNNSMMTPFQITVKYLW